MLFKPLGVQHMFEKYEHGFIMDFYPFRYEDIQYIFSYRCVHIAFALKNDILVNFLKSLLNAPSQWALHEKCMHLFNSLCLLKASLSPW